MVGVKISSAFLASLGSLGMIVAVASPAQASTRWNSGTRISAPSWGTIDMTISSFNGTSRCGGTDAKGGVKYSGDFVYVYDSCRDGRSAVVLVHVIQGSHNGDKRICRNSRGYGTWVRCNWNWPESPTKQLLAGVYSGNTGYLSWDYGRDRYFRG